MPLLSWPDYYIRNASLEAVEVVKQMLIPSYFYKAEGKTCRPPPYTDAENEMKSCVCVLYFSEKSFAVKWANWNCFCLVMGDTLEDMPPEYC